MCLECPSIYFGERLECDQFIKEVIWRHRYTGPGTRYAPLPKTLKILVPGVDNVDVPLPTLLKSGNEYYSCLGE